MKTFVPILKTILYIFALSIAAGVGAYISMTADSPMLIIILCGIVGFVIGEVFLKIKSGM